MKVALIYLMCSGAPSHSTNGGIGFKGEPACMSHVSKMYKTMKECEASAVLTYKNTSYADKTVTVIVSKNMTACVPTEPKTVSKKTYKMVEMK